MVGPCRRAELIVMDPGWPVTLRRPPGMGCAY